MRVFALLFLALSCVFANIPELYEKQIQTLRKLDIDSSFLSDPIFVEVKRDLKDRHSLSLVKAVQEYYDFVPMIKQIIAKEGLPEEIFYLAVVESGLKTHSVSGAKAVGIWQLMQPTATSLGLNIDPYIDERRDPIKSTYAALSYLQSLKDEFGKWYLALLAYNCGNTKLRSAIKKAGSDELSILLDKDKKYLPLETRVFIRKILTLAFLSHDREFLLAQDSSLMNYTLANEFIKLEVPKSVSLKDLAQLCDLDFKSFKVYNSHFKYEFTHPKLNNYIYLPLSNLNAFNASEPNKLAKVDTSIPQTKIYIVKQGDSLYSIARRNKISISDIRELNRIKNNHLSINQKLIIPIKTQEKNYANYQDDKKKDFTKIVTR